MSELIQPPSLKDIINLVEELTPQEQQRVYSFIRYLVEQHTEREYTAGDWDICGICGQPRMECSC